MSANSNGSGGDHDSTRNYEVGYKRPPKHSQFPKGHSGSRRGRPKDLSVSRDTVLRILNKKLMGIEDGKRRRMSKFELGLTNLVNKAATGDRLAWRELRNTMDYFDIKLGTDGGGLIFIIEE
jgi:hypothetical protein